MLKDAIVDHRLPVMMAVQVEGGMTPGQVAMTPYDTNSPTWQDGMLDWGLPDLPDIVMCGLRTAAE